MQIRIQSDVELFYAPSLSQIMTGRIIFGIAIFIYTKVLCRSNQLILNV